MTTLSTSTAPTYLLKDEDMEFDPNHLSFAMQQYCEDDKNDINRNGRWDHPPCFTREDIFGSSSPVVTPSIIMKLGGADGESAESAGDSTTSILSSTRKWPKEVLEPTPIAQNGVVVVENLPLASVTFGKDDDKLLSSCLDSVFKHHHSTEPLNLGYEEQQQEDNHLVVRSLFETVGREESECYKQQNHQHYNHHDKEEEDWAMMLDSTPTPAPAQREDEQPEKNLISKTGSVASATSSSPPPCFPTTKKKSTCNSSKNIMSLPVRRWSDSAQHIDLLLSRNLDETTSNMIFDEVNGGGEDNDEHSASSSLSPSSLSSSNKQESSSSSVLSKHAEQWSQRYQDLVTFRSGYGHCLVPLNWPVNPSLAHWIKRQRYQFRMKREGKHSTLTDERQMALESLGFVWDSHAAGWEERWNELRDFRERHGHCNVPKNFPENQQLAVWVKCQRRQFKLFSVGRASNMTRARIGKLQTLGFVFDPRSHQRRMTIGHF